MYLINPVFLYAVDAETHIINHHVLAFLRQVIEESDYQTADGIIIL